MLNIFSYEVIIKLIFDDVINPATRSTYDLVLKLSEFNHLHIRQILANFQIIIFIIWIIILN